MREAAGEGGNEQLDVTGLPRLADVTWQPPAPRWLLARLAGPVVAAALVVVAAVAVARSPLGAGFALAAGLPALAVVVVAGALRALEVRRTGFAVRERDVSLRRGVVATSESTAPYARVQHVRIERDPLERRLGLASLHLRTAGGGIELPGLHADDAERLRALVVERAGAHAELERADDDADAADADADGDAADAVPLRHEP